MRSTTLTILAVISTVLVAAAVMISSSLEASDASPPLKPVLPSDPNATPTPPGTDDDDRDAAVGWVRQNAIPFSSSSPEADHDELLQLKELIGDARIVALGEATHGTHEFSRMKHRLTRFLVEEMGFNLFAWEIGMPEGERIDAFIQTGVGDPEESGSFLKGTAWLEMIRWMREFNASKEGALRFFGLDAVSGTTAVPEVRRFIEAHDPDFLDELQSYSASRMSLAAQGDLGYTGMMTAIPCGQIAGRTVKYSGYVRTEAITRGFATLWMACDAPGGSRRYESHSVGSAPVGSTPWTRYELEAEVPSDCQGAYIGAVLYGNGTAWFDSLAIEGVANDGPSRLDLDFDSDDSPAGWREMLEWFPTPYRSAVTEEVRHSGQGSLRLRYENRSTAAERERYLREAWGTARHVLTHMESSRSAYYERAGARETEWAIQSARTVVQALEAEAGFTSRDSSMASNVEWLLSQSPEDAKIVLSAHNGHVAKRPGRMGLDLDRRYGDEMVVLAFAFHDGTYYIVQGHEVVEKSALPPSSDSFEWVLHRVGVPRFIVDLRGLYDGLPATSWLLDERPFRAIGSSRTPLEFLPTRVARDFDAIVYFDRTGASKLLSE